MYLLKPNFLLVIISMLLYQIDHEELQKRRNIYLKIYLEWELENGFKFGISVSYTFNLDLKFQDKKWVQNMVGFLKWELKNRRKITTKENIPFINPHKPEESKKKSKKSCWLKIWLVVITLVVEIKSCEEEGDVEKYTGWKAEEECG